MGYDWKYGQVNLERGTVGEDEPVVVFRAQDTLLPKLLRVYQLMCEIAGSPQHHLDLIHQSAMRVKLWQESHETKVPESANHKP